MSWGERKPCCKSGKCSDPATEGKTPLKMEICSGGAAMDWLRMVAWRRRVAWEGKPDKVSIFFLHLLIIKTTGTHLR